MKPARCFRPACSAPNQPARTGVWARFRPRSHHPRTRRERRSRRRSRSRFAAAVRRRRLRRAQAGHRHDERQVPDQERASLGLEPGGRDHGNAGRGRPPACTPAFGSAGSSTLRAPCASRSGERCSTAEPFDARRPDHDRAVRRPNERRRRVPYRGHPAQPNYRARVREAGGQATSPSLCRHRSLCGATRGTPRDERGRWHAAALAGPDQSSGVRAARPAGAESRARGAIPTARHLSRAGGGYELARRAAASWRRSSAVPEPRGSRRT
jgi:hypothetical protein